MVTVTVASEKLDKVLGDVEVLLDDVSALFDFETATQRRLAEMKADPSKGKSEKNWMTT